jgi:hypothetical protein
LAQGVEQPAAGRILKLVQVAQMVGSFADLVIDHQPNPVLYGSGH